MSPLRWTCKSTRQLATALQAQGHRVSHQLVSELLHSTGYICREMLKPLRANNILSEMSNFSISMSKAKTS